VGLIKTGNVATVVLELAFCIAIVILISRARKGLKVPSIRKVAGLDALDEAIGRATEMGATVHFSPGIAAVDNAQTLAAISILGYVARVCAKYDTRLIQTNRNNVVYSIAEEVVKQAYAEVGKSDAFNADDVRFIAEDQFAYASGCVGIMHREKVRANILIGGFWAESLIFAEVGAQIGSIQIAGTANTHQIPFFIAACDYALLGEEIYAASAYLTREPVLLGCLVGQDWGKMAGVALVLIGAVMATMNNNSFRDLLNK
jgi:hypothetical protein